MFGCPEYLHRRTDVRQAVRLGNRALHHDLSVPGQRDARADVVAEVNDLPERARQTAAGMPVDCIPGRADLHPLRPQRYGNSAAARHRLDQRTFDWSIANGDADRATAVGNGLQPALEAVVLADETRDERVPRVLVHLLRRVELLDLAAVKYGDPIRHRERLGLIVSDVHHGDAEPLMQLPDLELHLLAQLFVERAQRLVHEDQLRLEHQRARHRDPLLLAAGELRRPPLAEAGELHHAQRALDPPGDI